MKIMNALAGGYSAKQILAYMKKLLPNLSSRIDAAEAAGFPIEKILEILGQNAPQKLQKVKPISESAKYQIQGNNNPYIQAQQAQQRGPETPALSAIAKTAVPAALGLAGSFALQRALPAIVQQLNPGMSQPNAPGPITPPIQPQQAQEPTPVQTPVQQIPAEQILTQMGIKEKVDAMLKSGNTPEAISAVLSAQGRARGQTDPEMIKTITEYAQTKPKEEKSENLSSVFGSLAAGATDKLYEGIFDALQKGKDTFSGVKDPLINKAKPYFDKGLIKSPQDLKDFANNPEKFKSEIQGRQAVFPDGKIGTIESSKDGIAKVNVDGQIRHRNENDLTISPLPEKDMADLYSDLIEGIKKSTGQEVSRNVYWSGYDPNTNELAYIPHSGELYTYKDISPEDVKELTSLLTQRKTSGESYIGAWEAGTTSPIGASMFKLIQKLQKERGGKGNEYSGKFQKIYSALEPAEKALKEKKKKKKDEEKRKKSQAGK